MARPILAEIVGYGASSDGADMVAPQWGGCGQLYETRLKQTGLTTVDYINTHGTSTPIGDITELEAIRRVFGW